MDDEYIEHPESLMRQNVVIVVLMYSIISLLNRVADLPVVLVA